MKRKTNVILLAVLTLLLSTCQLNNTYDKEIVYITETGCKFHRRSCQYLWNSCYCTSRTNAISKGYSACSVCNP